MVFPYCCFIFRPVKFNLVICFYFNVALMRCCWGFICPIVASSCSD